jgi:hypothetical protein
LILLKGPDVKASTRSKYQNSRRNLRWRAAIPKGPQECKKTLIRLEGYAPRIKNVCLMLAAGKRRLCCFDGLDFMAKG